MDTSSRQAEFAGLVHQTASLWRTMLDRQLRPHGFSQATWRVLITLKRLSGVCNQTELAALLAIEAPTLVRLLDRLEAHGWVRRASDPDDRRSKRVSLTEASLDIGETLEREVGVVRRELLREISPEELSVCITVLDKLQRKTEALVRES